MTGVIAEIMQDKMIRVTINSTREKAIFKNFFFIFDLHIRTANKHVYQLFIYLSIKKI